MELYLGRDTGTLILIRWYKLTYLKFLQEKKGIGTAAPVKIEIVRKVSGPLVCLRLKLDLLLNHMVLKPCQISADLWFALEI